jgi:hypothetical protein
MRFEDDLVLTGLAPLVWVAWADGRVDEEERQAVLEQARSCGIGDESPSQGRLEAWLAEPPPESLRARWRSLVRTLRATLPPPGWERFRRGSLQMSHDVAEASGSFLSLTTGVSEAEERAILGVRAVLDAA